MLYGSKCPICNVQMSKERGPRQAVKNHCHKTGNDRAIICHRCNVGLGMFRDSIEIMVSAVVYLQIVGKQGVPKFKKQKSVEKAARVLGVPQEDMEKVVLLLKTGELAAA